MTQNEMKKRIADLENTIMEIHSHSVSIAHHRARIEIEIQKLFSKKDFLIRSQSGGPKPIAAKHAKELFRLMKLHEAGK